MKKWNSPEIQVLDINETESGCFPWFWESCISQVPTCPNQPSEPTQPTEPQGPTETPSDEDPTEQFS